LIAAPRPSGETRFSRYSGTAASLARRASTSSADGGIFGRSGGGLKTSAATSFALVMLSTLCTPGSLPRAAVTRAIFVSASGEKTSLPSMPTTPTSSLPNCRRTSL
jgi:hypothetical protein